MNEQTRRIADDLHRLAVRGRNPYAAIYWLRIIAADDPDAEAERIKAEVHQFIVGVTRAFRPLRRAFEQVAREARELR
jgi:hypothetical protein